MKPMIFKQKSELRSFIAGMENPCLDESVAIKSALGDMTFEEVQGALLERIEDAFSFKEGLAKLDGGLGNRKSVRKMTESYMDIFTQSNDPQMMDAIKDAHETLKELTDQEGPFFTGLVNKLKNLLFSSEKKAKDSLFQACETIVATSVEALLSKFDDHSEKILSVAKRQIEREKDVEIVEHLDECLADFKRVQSRTAEFARLQIDFNKFFILAMIERMG